MIEAKAMGSSILGLIGDGSSIVENHPVPFRPFTAFSGYGHFTAVAS
jgi:hypothetical protein